MSLRENFDKLIDELKEERDSVVAHLHLAKIEALGGWDKFEEFVEELKEEKDEARVNMHLAKLEAQEALDHFGDQFKV